MEKILKEAREYFDMDYGIVSHIFNNQYQVIAFDGKDDSFKVGETFPLDGVYCNVVYKTKSMFAVDDVESSSGKLLHPLYTAINLRSYIGSPLNVNGDLFGTLNFTSFDKKEIPFAKNDIDKMIYFSEKIGLLLSDSEK